MTTPMTDDTTDSDDMSMTEEGTEETMGEMPMGEKEMEAGEEGMTEEGMEEEVEAPEMGEEATDEEPVAM